jgi:transglutaminase-like putative cysteine protease
MPTTDLEISHETRYAYGAPVSLAHHLAHLRPLDDAHQQLLLHELTTEPEGDTRTTGIDSFGNACTWLSRALPHDELLVRTLSHVRVGARFRNMKPEASPPWNELARSLRYVAKGPYNPAVEFTMPSHFVPRLEVLRDYATPSFPAGRPVAVGAIDLMHRLHADFEYRSASTQIDTPLLKAFNQRAGWAPMRRTPGSRSTARPRPACRATGSIWIRPTTSCPAADTCAWPSAATSVM